jgi:hypothetical protein
MSAFNPTQAFLMRYYGEGTCSAGCVDLSASDFSSFMPRAFSHSRHLLRHRRSHVTKVASRGRSKECSTFDGRDTADTLTDVCAKLKYVRSIAVGTDTNFSCPRDTSSLVGLPANRIRSMWGEPNFVERATSPNRTGSGTRWSYFIGSPKPGQEGGGFPELSLRLVDGVVGSVSCALSM